MRLSRAFVLASLAVALAACGGGLPAASTRQRPRASTTPAVTAVAARDTTSPGTACRAPHPPGDFVETIESSGLARSFRVHIPPGYDSGTPTPLVLDFHGYDRSAADQEAYSGLVPVADRAGFILVSPDGAGDPQQWEVLDVYPESTTADVQFTRAMVERLRAEYCIDRTATFATGMSNGAEMASQVGCLLPDIFAAVAPVAGAVYQDGRCDGPAVAIIAFQGTDDENVPFATAPPAMAGWAAHNGCDTQGPTVETLTTHVSREAYRGCGGEDVVLYTIAGGGHTWPGSDADFPRGGAGATTDEISASDLIWAFFDAHRR
jgi:polyhydroxybutyrate depolymerase